MVFLISTDDVWFQAGLELRNQLQDAGIYVLKPAAFQPGEFKTEMLTEVKRSGIRINAPMAEMYDIEAIAWSASVEQMTVTGWAWIIAQDIIAHIANEAAVLMKGWLCDFARAALMRVDPPPVLPEMEVENLQSLFDWFDEDSSGRVTFFSDL